MTTARPINTLDISNAALGSYVCLKSSPTLYSLTGGNVSLPQTLLVGWELSWAVLGKGAASEGVNLLCKHSQSIPSSVSPGA